jgi:hypothetical protein
MAEVISTVSGGLAIGQGVLQFLSLDQQTLAGSTFDCEAMTGRRSTGNEPAVVVRFRRWQRSRTCP